MPGRPSRRSVLAASLALPLGAALAGCTASTPQAAQSTGRAARIVFWSALRGSQQVVDAFNKSQNKIQVVFQQIPSGDFGGYAKLSNAARAGNSPDVATIEYPQVPGYAIDGVASDITDLVSDSLRAKLLPQALGLTTFAGRVFTVPLDVEPMVLHYRKDVFDEFGFQVPRTWDEYAALARAVRERLPAARLGVFATDGAPQFAAFAWQAGAQWFGTRGGAWNVSLADAPTRKVADYWQRLNDDGDLFVNAATGRQYDAQLSQNLVLTKLSGAWDAGAQMKSRPGQKGRWAIAPMPQWDPAKPVVGTHGGSTFAVSKDSQNPEAAMEFIEWQVSHPDALRARLSSGASSQYPVASALVDVGRQAFDRAYYGGQDIYTLFAAEAEKIRDGWTWGPRMTATNRVMQDGFAKASGGDGTILDAVRDAHNGTMPDLAALGLATTEHSS
ncbi:ABC transporter substrate-binding protein [Amycolatopsis sp. lyj-112]|uniref:ABC transporter substrate-binding protein n=1 Tax=Amycolatopsis sp. lyj-112 TaxID=2789288 RepID=UPI003978382E